MIILMRYHYPPGFCIQRKLPGICSAVQTNNLSGFFSLDNPEATEAFKLAYGDVKAAFQYYLSHYNNGRPIIIASHSQGTVMAVWLLQEFFDGTPLQKQLVAAYITGMPVYNDDFTFIPVCDSASQQQCYVSWRSLYGHEPPRNTRSETGKMWWW